MQPITPKEYQKLATQKKSKYKAKRTLVDGISFHSKKEADYYLTLKQKKQHNEIEFFLRQVPIHLPGNTKYLLDFLVVYKNRLELIDVKGYDTPLSKLKRKQAENIYGFTITLI